MQSSPLGVRMSGLTGVSAEDLAACTKLLAGGSKSFRAASFLLPRRIAAPAAALYAFCRVADDAIDMSDDPASSLVELHQRLDQYRHPYGCNESVFKDY